ncbi:unnamed protein product [Hymenolepis diminuta]|nr:unnamed protein product [Hymenolepis diminuta]
MIVETTSMTPDTCEDLIEVPDNRICDYDPCCHLQLRDFIQTMPNIRTDLICLLYGQSPELIKYIFNNHKDIKSLISAADHCTLAYFMKNLDNFGDILAKFEGEYIDWIFGKLYNPCYYFCTLPRRVRDMLVIKSYMLPCCGRQH